MPVVMQCPSGHRLKVPKKYGGRRIVCPVCEARVDVPVASVQQQNEIPILAEPVPTPASEASAEIVDGSRFAQPEATVRPSVAKNWSAAAGTGFDSNTVPPSEPSSPPPHRRLTAEHVMELETELEKVGEEVETGMDFSLRETLPDLPREFELITATDIEARGEAVHTIADVERTQFYNVVVLAGASILLGVLCLSPSLMEQRVARQFGQRVPDAWSYIVMLGAIVQIGISLFAIRIPDWSTVWLLTVLSTSVAAVYACGLAITMFATPDHELVRQLGLLDESHRYLAQPWCFLVTCIALMLAFWCGRFSVAWYQSEVRRALVGT